MSSSLKVAEETSEGLELARVVLNEPTVRKTQGKTNIRWVEGFELLRSQFNETLEEGRWVVGWLVGWLVSKVSLVR